MLPLDTVSPGCLQWEIVFQRCATVNEILQLLTKFNIALIRPYPQTFEPVFHPFIQLQIFFYMHQVNMVQLQICLGYFTLQSRSMIKIYLCISNVPLIYVNPLSASVKCLSVPPLYSDSNQIKNSDQKILRNHEYLYF